MNKHIAFFHWLPRLLCIAAIFFIAVLSLGSFGDSTTAKDLIMLLLPSTILTALLAIAWRWEKAGGLLFLSIGLGLMPFIYNLNHGRNHFSVSQSLLVVLIINIPFVLVGILFLISHRQKNKRRITLSS